MPLGTSGDVSDARAVVATLLTARAEEEEQGLDQHVGPSEREKPSETQEPKSLEEPELTEGKTLLPEKGGQRRPARYGLNIQFEDRPDDEELGRLVESTVLVNQAHPAYRRAVVSRSVGYHIALAVAMSLAPLAVEPAQEHAFVTAFLSRWGEALEQPKGQKRRKR